MLIYSVQFSSEFFSTTVNKDLIYLSHLASSIIAMAIDHFTVPPNASK